MNRNLIPFWVVVSSVIGLAAFWIARGHVRDSNEDSVPNRVLHALKGLNGDRLREQVAVLWTRFDSTVQTVPRVVWFANFNVLAHASDRDGDRRIEVSSGLWERAIREEPIAEAILAHELAHLVHRDTKVFSALEASVAAVRVILWRVFLISATLYLYYLVANLVTAIDSSTRSRFLKVLSDIAGATSILVVLPLCVIAARRYAGFLAALIEIRADVFAALRTGGIQKFAHQLVFDPMRRRLSLSALRSSLFSLNLTHVPDTDRLAILGSLDRLQSPKLRYFAFSLFLAMLFPINGLTYLFLGGAIDHLMITAVVMVFYATAIRMLVQSAPAAQLSWRRTFSLAAALCIAMALPQINLAGLGYLLSHFVVGITETGGFGNTPLTAAQMGEDILVTFGGILSDVKDSVGSGWILLAVAIGGFSLRGITFVAAKSDGRGSAIATLAVCVGVLFSCYHKWRGQFFEILPLDLVVQWSSITEAFPWIRLCLPLAAAFVSILLLSSVRYVVTAALRK